MRVIVLAVALMAVTGCGESRDMHRVGVSDGYATGYNTTCKIRATLVEGAWEDKEYKRGYDKGYAEGAAACLSGVKH